MTNKEFAEKYVGKRIIGKNIPKNEVVRVVGYAPYTDAIIVSLGRYIIVNNSYHGRKAIPHEYGHCIQSQRLGWFYLLLVGLPSITFNILTRLGILDYNTYYDRYPEKQADILGGVER